MSNGVGGWTNERVRAVLRASAALALYGGLVTSIASAQSSTTPSKPATKAKVAPAAQTPAAPATPKGTPAFNAARLAGDKALAENRLDDAVGEYFKAVKLQPNWAEGWWHLGMISYEQDRYQPARDAFKRVVSLSQNNATGWGFLGLSEFKLADYDQALEHLMRARMLGIQGSPEASTIVRYHAAILFSRLGEFERAVQLLNEFAVEANDGPRVIEAFGIATLRLPLLPSELPPEKRDVAMLAGRAQYLSGARMLPAAKQAFEQVVVRYPAMANLHYAYGQFLLAEEPDRGIQELEKEIRLTPGHSQAMLALAFEYLRRAELDTAGSWAEKAIAADPSSFAAHKALGQVLFEKGDAEGAVRELEAGVKLAPDSPSLHFQLAKAYQKAGRAAEAEKERAEFTRLDRAVRAARAGSQSLGGVSDTSAAAPNQQD